MISLASLTSQDLALLQDAWTNVILQAGIFPESSADMTPEQIEQLLVEVDTDAAKPGAEGQKARAKASHLFALLRDYTHLSMSGKAALMSGLNGKSRAVYDLAVASTAAGTIK